MQTDKVRSFLQRDAVQSAERGYAIC